MGLRSALRSLMGNRSHQSDKDGLPSENQTSRLTSSTPEVNDRLERIVDHCDNDRVKAAFYNKIGNKEKAALYDQKILKEREGYANANPIDKLEGQLHYALEHGTASEQQQKARELYDACLKAENYVKVLGVGRKFLSLPHEKITEFQEKILFQAMTCSGGLYLSDVIYLHGSPPMDTGRFIQYIDDVRIGGKSRRELIKLDKQYKREVQQLYGCEEWQEIPLERAQEIGRRAYDALLVPNLQDRFGQEEQYLQAGLIAKYFGWQKEMDAAGQKIAEHITKHMTLPTSTSCAHAALEELKLSQLVTHQLILPLFDHYIGYETKDAEKLRTKYDVPDEKVAPLIQNSYQGSLRYGNFSVALKLRSFYARFIVDNSVSMDDLKALVEILGQNHPYNLGGIPPPI